MTRVAIIAAMPAELKPLVRGWRHERYNGVDLWRWRFDKSELIAACAGAGVEAATRAFAETEKDGPICLAISTGWAGALRADLVRGHAYKVSGVIDVRTGERFQVPEQQEQRWLVTGSKVADRKEKQRLGLRAWLEYAASPFIASKASVTAFGINCPISIALSC
jgi:adenosylhomocysteine nucleosidase